MAVLRNSVRTAFSCIVFVCALAAQQTGSAENNLPVPTFGTTVVASSGLRGDIYLLRPGTDSLPRFARKKPVGTIYTTALNVPPRDFREGFPGIVDRIEWFAIEYSGRFWIEHAGRYRFALTSDDGAKLYLDRRLVIDNDGLHPPSGCSATVQLTYGIHDIRVSYFQGPGYDVALILTVAAPNEPWRVFDTAAFTPPPGAVSSGGTLQGKTVGRIHGGKCWAQ